MAENSDIEISRAKNYEKTREKKYIYIYSHTRKKSEKIAEFDDKKKRNTKIIKKKEERNANTKAHATTFRIRRRERLTGRPTANEKRSTQNGFFKLQNDCTLPMNFVSVVAARGRNSRRRFFFYFFFRSSHAPPTPSTVAALKFGGD